ncbi:MAG: hypothetical protein ACYTGB_11120 [Planctomycetota bacterium]|jgi:hypothetical protein
MRPVTTVMIAIVLLLSASAHAADPQVVLIGTAARTEGGKTECEIRAELTSGRLVDVDLAASGVKLTDDKGSDLGAKPAGALSDYAKQPWFATLRALPGGRTVQLAVRSPKAAAKDAASVTVEGTLKLTYSGTSQDGESEITLAEGAACELAGLKGTVAGLVRDERAAEFSIKLAGAAAVHFDSLALRGADGSQVPCSAGVARAPGDTQALLIRFRGVRAAGEKLKLAWTAWSGLRTTDLNFSLVVPMEGSNVKAQSLRLALAGGGSAATPAPDPDPGTEPSTEPDPDEPDVAAVGELGVKVLRELPAGKRPVVFVTKPPQARKGLHYIVTLVPAAKTDTSWGFWQMIKADTRKYTLRTPRHKGDHEIRIGRIKYPAKAYEVVERIKVRVR